MIELGLCFDTESSNTGNKAGRTPHDGKDCIMQSVVRVKKLEWYPKPNGHNFWRYVHLFS